MKLPPLNAIKVFEAAARNGSFVAAAAELGVSPAAVSMQIRKLEAFLGKDLFIRGNNSIVMTDAGQLIYPRMAQALTEISQTTERILDYDIRSSVVISTLQSVSDRWLVPNVADFANRHPTLGIEIRIDNDPVDFAKDRIDLRVTLGDRFYPGLSSVHLFHDEVTPICAPDFLAQGQAGNMLMDIPDARFVRIEWGGSYASYPTWSDWFKKAGHKRALDPRVGIRVGGAGIAAAVALRGGGIMLGSRRLLAQELRAGSLIAPFDVALAMPQPYHAVLPPGISGIKDLSRALRDLLFGLGESSRGIAR
ncbi:MAG: LysR family transcriptional regulator [Rhodobacteraceae bacterium]|nr:LysR family transcriptional regulator [Paracoccaceae bacterium]